MPNITPKMQLFVLVYKLTPSRKYYYYIVVYSFLGIITQSEFLDLVSTRYKGYEN